MAVKYPKKFVSRSYFSTVPKERNSNYSLRNSSFNCSRNSLTEKTINHFSSPVSVKKQTTEKNIKLCNMKERKSEYNLRNVNVSYNELPKRISKSLKSTSNIKAEHPIKKKLKKTDFTPVKRNENCVRNSCLITNNNSRPKRSASCIDYTPGIKFEHPMRKRLRELAYISKPKNAFVTNPNVARNLELNDSPLTCNQIRSLNSISSKSINSENEQKTLKKSLPSRTSTRSSTKAVDTPVMKDVIISNCSARKQNHTLKFQPKKTSYSLELQMKGLESVCEDELVLKRKTVNVKSSLETPVNKQKCSRSFRKGCNSRNLCDGKVALGQFSVSSNDKRVADKNITEMKDSLKVRYSETSTPVTTRLKKIISDVKIQSEGAITLPKRSQKENHLPLDSCLKSSAKSLDVVEEKKSQVKTRSSKAKEKAVVEDKEQKNFQRKTRGKSTALEKPFDNSMEKRITRSATFHIQDKLSPNSSFPKKSKRHTFPNSDKCLKSKNHLRVYSVHHFNNVPLDILTKPGASFRESQSDTLKTGVASLKKIAPKTSLQANNDVSMKTPVSKMRLKKKKNVGLPEKTSGPKKVPAKGTLRRTRWIMSNLKQKNEGHEDDIFENKKLEFPKPFFGPMISDDESDSTDVSIATPVCGFLLTPNVTKKSPHYKPCISSNDLTAARRVAEEYLYRRNKTWKQRSFPERRAVTSENNQVSEKGTEYSDALANVLKAQTDFEKLLKEESDEEDDYFSDVS